MTKTEILEELHKLTPDERLEIRLKLTELDGEGWLDVAHPLTAEEKILLEARLADTERHPEKSIPWEEAEKRIEERFGK
jgi:putative addiction module component (TIGR02574 family)